MNYSQDSMERYKNIDILKFIGLLCIILAHVSPPAIIQQLRGFDVILMIILSSYLYFEKEDNIVNYFKYIWKRIKRLLFPTYLFLIIFFMCVFIIDVNKFSLKTILSSILLHEGIGYVWIIRIYILTAILLPIIEKMIKKYQISKVIIFNVLLYVLYEILYYFGILNLNIIFTDIVAYLIPCISVIVVTYWLKQNYDNNKKILKFSIINIIIFVLLAFIIYKITGEIKNTNYAKYPFRLYYLSYAFGMSGILFLIFKCKKIVNMFYNKFVSFVSKSSLWIYLWHIFFVYFIDFCADNLNWFVKYVIIITCSCLVTYIQNKVVDKLEDTIINQDLLKILRG